MGLNNNINFFNLKVFKYLKVLSFKAFKNRDYLL